MGTQLFNRTVEKAPRADHQAQIDSLATNLSLYSDLGAKLVSDVLNDSPPEDRLLLSDIVSAGLPKDVKGNRDKFAAFICFSKDLPRHWASAHDRKFLKMAERLRDHLTERATQMEDPSFVGQFEEMYDKSALKKFENGQSVREVVEVVTRESR